MDDAERISLTVIGEPPWSETGDTRRKEEVPTFNIMEAGNRQTRNIDRLPRARRRPGIATPWTTSLTAVTAYNLTQTPCLPTT